MTLFKFKTPLTKVAAIVLLATTSLTACNQQTTKSTIVEPTKNQQQAPLQLVDNYSDRLDIYKEVVLTADLSHLSANQKQMLALLIDASKIMDDLFWQQAFSQDKKSFLAAIKDKKFVVLLR